MGDELQRPGRFSQPGDSLEKFRQGPPPAPRPGPLVGRSDPETSGMAASIMRRPGKLAEAERLILGVLAHNPAGLDACQIAERLAWKTCRGEPRDYGWWRLEVSRRMKRLVETRRCLAGPKHRSPVTHTWQRLWMPAPRQQHWLERQEAER